MAVFVLDKRKNPLMPCSEKRARLLLERGRAVVHRVSPFTIRLKDRIGGEVQPVRVKLDPGSQTDEETDAVRVPRFDNRRRREGWLAPSLQHRVDTLLSWVGRLRRLAPVQELTVERVRFGTQALQNPDIAGVEYQQGTLFGYEAREYLLEKWGRRCVYCGGEGVLLQLDHLHPRSRGGSNRLSNLAPACEDCNRRKSNRDIREFLAHDPARVARGAELAAALPLRAVRRSVFRHTDQQTGFVGGLFAMAGNGDAGVQTGVGVHLYACNAAMSGRFVYDADGELPIVAQQGTLPIRTDPGPPRGLRFQMRIEGFVPGGSGLHVSAHGPDAETFARATAAELKPHLLGRAGLAGAEVALRAGAAMTERP